MALSSAAAVVLACAGAPEPLTAEELAGADPALGARLFDDLRCAACHASPEARLDEGLGPRLAALGARVRSEWLRAYLADGRRHPTALPTGAGDRDDLLHFLLAQGAAPAAPESVPLDLVEAGRQLYHAVGCVACHDPLEHADDLAGPLWSFSAGFEEGVSAPPQGARSLAHLPQKTTPAALAAQLQDPRAVHPGGRMPGMRLDEREAASLAAYLCAEGVHGGRLELASEPGLEFEYHEYDGELDDSRAAFDARAPVRRGVAPRLDGLPEHREEMFGFRFRGFVEVPAAGEWTFHLTSDDGSRLWLDGELLVDHGGDHSLDERSGTRRLTAGAHALELTFYERTGTEGLELSWSGPGVAREVVPGRAFSRRAVPLAPGGRFEVESARAARGAARFDALGCGACHPLESGARPPGGPALDALEPLAPGGCLGSRPARGTPRYALDASARAALARFVAEPPRGRLERDLEALGCLACHARDGSGGPPPERAAYFRVLGGVDLGDEGRLPPHLDGAGAKLTLAALERTLLDARRPAVRPYLAVRMPDYGAEHVAHLPALLRAADAPRAPAPAPAFSPEAVEQGRRLASAGALGCIQCHDLGTYPSLGIRAVNLADVHGRIELDWFRQLMLDPRAIGMNSRMPLFWSDGRSPSADVLDGDPARQTDAVWSWLSLGASMPLPDGLALPENEYELTPLERPILCGVFMRDVGPRTLLVGFPERLHYAFDMAGSRLAKVWRGRFFDARGTWHARAGELERPPSDDVLDLAAGPPFALLAAPDEAWPVAGERVLRPLGWHLDARGVPTHRYALGAVTIEERPEPRFAEGGARLVRHFRVLSAPAGLVWRVAEGRALAEQGAGVWSVDEARFRLRLPPGAAARVRASGTRKELLVALPAADELELEVEIAW